jgi:chromosome segregation ATPase
VLVSRSPKWDKGSVPQFDTTRVPARPAAGPAPFPEVVLTLAEAAWSAGLAREELEVAVRQGELRVRRVLRGGRLVAVVALEELQELHRRQGEVRREAREETHQLRERVARLEGELESSERVERSLNRYADRLEERYAARVGELQQALALARRREMTLARALGRAEGQVARLEERVASSLGAR